MGLFKLIFKPCSNCGKKNPKHTCYIGGDKSSIYHSEKDHDLVARQMELNQARGRDPFDGVNPELRSRYMRNR